MLRMGVFLGLQRLIPKVTARRRRVVFGVFGAGGDSGYEDDSKRWRTKLTKGQWAASIS